MINSMFRRAHTHTHTHTHTLLYRYVCLLFLLLLVLLRAISTIMAAAILLPSPPAVRHAQSVSEWLSLLQLSSLEDRFRDYTLDTISTLWDIQLTTVRIYVCTYVCMLYVFMYECMYVRMYVHVCMYVCMYIMNVILHMYLIAASVDSQYSMFICRQQVHKNMVICNCVCVSVLTRIF